MAESPEFKKLYDGACKQLADLLLIRDVVEANVIRIRKDITSFAALCENHGIKIDPSIEAEYLLKTSLADEIRRVFSANYEREFRPNELKEELKKLGHDLTRYNNPQSAIHMVLKRMADSKEIKELENADGKSTYMMENPLRSLLKRFGQLKTTADVAGDSIAKAVEAIAKNTFEGNVAVPAHIRDFLRKK